MQTVRCHDTEDNCVNITKLSNQLTDNVNSVNCTSTGQSVTSLYTAEKRDAMLSPIICRLCLLPARYAVSCSQGDVFCRECVIRSLISQRAEIHRNKSTAKLQEVAKERKLREERAVEQESIRRFEHIMLGISPVSSSSSSLVPDLLPASSCDKSFHLDERQLIRVASSQRARIRADLALQHEEKRRARSLSFWVPSQTPDVRDTLLPFKAEPITPLNVDSTSPTKLSSSKRTYCPISRKVSSVHEMSLKSMITINFSKINQSCLDSNMSTPSIASENLPCSDSAICPNCLKPLSNMSAAVLARNCGHCVCTLCFTRFILESLPLTKSSACARQVSCLVCDAKISIPDAISGALVTVTATPSDVALHTNTRIPAGFILLQSPQSNRS